MSLSTDEINKVNHIYKQVDILTAENNLLRENTHDHSNLLGKLESIESKLDKLLIKGSVK